VLAHSREVRGDEDGIEYEDRSLCEMVQGPVRDTVRSRSLADLETPDGFMKLLLGFVGRAHKVRPQRHFNQLNNCRDRRIGYRLKLNLQIVGKGFGLLRV